MRSMRGLYVIRGGIGAGLSSQLAVRAADDSEAPDDGRLGTLSVSFSRFNTWYEIDSIWEGRFLERTVPGSFRKTIKERASQVKVMFNHGMEFNEGSKLLGPIEVLEEREDGPYMQVRLLDAPFARELVPGLLSDLYGSSFMFEVVGEAWQEQPRASEHNPERLPERTITEVRLYEAGPVTWPANPEATAALRSGMDWYAEQVQSRDPDRHAELVRSFTAFRALHGIDTPRAVTPHTSTPDTPASEPSDRHVDGVPAAARQRRLALIDMARR